MTILVGGIGQLYQGDLDVGRRVVERLAADPEPDVVYEDLHYGAVAVAQRIEELGPRAVILVGAAERGRPPGTVERRRIPESPPGPERVRSAVADAVTGYVDVDLVVDVGRGFGVLPSRVVAVEIEPEATDPDEHLSERVGAVVGRAAGVVTTEILRLPVLETAARIRATVTDGHLEPSGATDAMTGLLEALDILDREGRWGRISAERDLVRGRIASGEVSEGMTHLDWALWWGLIEAIGRLEAREAAVTP